MKINLKAKNIELTPTIHDYVVKRVTNLEKLLSTLEGKDKEFLVNFEVGKSTNHHKAGEVFHTDCSISINGEDFYSSADEEDLYEAIDALKEKLFAEISKKKTKKEALFYRGARKIKDMLKGIKIWK